MLPLNQQKTIKIYYLMKQDGLALSSAPVSESGPLAASLGYFLSRDMAEINKTHQLLLLPAGSKTQYHIFPLTIPNPTFKENL